MIVIPAVDLRDGRCVQLVGGSYERERVSLNDPVAVAQSWRLKGFTSLHLVDLDAATGRGANTGLVESVIVSSNAVIQVGGGIRTSEQISRLFQVGAARVVVGTRALEDRKWLEEIAAANPGRIIVAIDVRDGKVVTHGWEQTRSRDVAVETQLLNDLPLAAVLVTAVHCEGLLLGPDISLIEQVAAHSSFPIQASGGIADAGDLDDLAKAGAAAAIVGMALYTGALGAADINKESFG